MASLNGNRRTLFIAALLVVTVYFFAGFYPFQLKTPSNNQRENGAVVSAEREFQFHAPGIAYTEKAPSWLKEAISTSRFEVSVEARSAEQEQYGPARIFTVSSDRSYRNLTVGQWGPDLSVRIRTPYTSINGTPTYLTENVFSDPYWHRIDVRIKPGSIEIRVDGDTVTIAAMPDHPLDDWDPDYRVALGNELSGDSPWLGDIRKAVVWVGDSSFDYLAPGALVIPERFTLKDYHAWNPVAFVDAPDKGAAVQDWVVNLLGFIPFGWLVVMLRWPRPGVVAATVLSAGISLTIELGQLLVFAGRYPSTQDIILNALGGALGAWLARRKLQA